MEALLVRLPPLGKIAETLGFGINGTLKGADRHLIVIAGVDHCDIRCRNQVVPLFGINVMSHTGDRIDVRLAHRNDLFFQADLHAMERRGLGEALFPFQISAAGERADMRDHGVNTRAAAGNGAVDPLPGNQQGA